MLAAVKFLKGAGGLHSRGTTGTRNEDGLVINNDNEKWRYSLDTFIGCVIHQ